MKVKKQFIAEIKAILSHARQSTYSFANSQLLQAYWTIGKKIIEEEQQGDTRAQYGSFLIRELAARLTEEFGNGFDERELRRMRQFFQYFPIWGAVRPELSWTHYRYLLRIDNEVVRQFYLSEAIAGGWNTRQLTRNINSQYYQRVLSSKQGQSPDDLSARDMIKDPYLLEFLGIGALPAYTEQQLEVAIIDKLQQFMLELGKGFAFVARQFCIRSDTKEFYIDLVFYNYILKCFVLVDLKINELTHQDVGQMDMYVRLFEDTRKVKGDNPTLGIILCSDKDETIVKYSVLHESKQLFASKYRLYLPDEKTLIREIETARERVNLHNMP
jgi:predicted nuclease of restriction endonuclease-like (RecB) superfamily